MISTKGLEIIGNKLSSDLVASSFQHSNLVHLSLQNNSLDWEAGFAIAESLKNSFEDNSAIKGLISLNLRGNRIKVLFYFIIEKAGSSTCS
jgi:Ran GTPase-activating protein (RanGAP) involved in mRNA processing and transport